MPRTNHLKVDTKTEKIYKLVKENILRGRLKPGEKIIGSKMADYYGVSIIPIREAFSRLQAEGFLETIPHTGTYVKDIEIENLVKIYPIRSLLEGYAVSLSAPLLTEADFEKLEKSLNRIDQLIRSNKYALFSTHNYEFHMTIYRACGNDHLIKMIEDLMDNTQRVRVTYDLMPERAIASNKEHWAIFNFLKNRDGTAAEREIKEHLEATLKALISSLE